MNKIDERGTIPKDKMMISVADAKKSIIENVLPTPSQKIQLGDAGGLILAEDIFSPIDIPSWPQSSMDGYAFSYQDWQSGQELKIVGEIAAGSSEPGPTLAGNATRIFTGAAVPPGADTVVMQEKTRTENGYLIIVDDALQPGLNVRPKGAEIRIGETALANGTLLRPAAIAFLASMGITHLMAYPPPSASIIVTGNELQQPGVPLAFGQVYESNSWSLQAALEQMHIHAAVYHAEDKLETLTKILGEALQNTDVVFLTGGVSVGDYDFVAAAAANNGIEKIFHKVKQRPGKPFYFGKKENKLVFGLPGNPASALSCFYEYVEPALKKMARQYSAVKIIHAPLSAGYKKAAGLTHFLKGFYDGVAVSLLPGQESFRLSSFASANCLVQIDEHITNSQAGEIVEVHLLP